MRAPSVMLDRKPLMSLLLGLTVCFSLWHIMLYQQQQYDPLQQILEESNDSIVSYVSQVLSTNMPLDIQLEDLPKNDFTQLIDFENFEFIINHQACKDLDRQPLIVIMVHSAPDNFHKRKVIRETWGERDARALLIFMIGAVNSTNLQEKVDLENSVHSDIVQGNFEDAYRNMTYKHVMAFKWFVYNCRDAGYLLKTDDDVFVNTPLMYQYLETPPLIYQQFHQERLLFCPEIARAKVKRTFRSKWRVSYDEYMESYFPNHCPGFCILYSSDIVLQLYLQAQKLPYFWIDDVHITGSVASKLNISIASTGSLFLSNEQQKDLMNGRKQAEDMPFFFARPNLSEMNIRRLWKVVRYAKANNTKFSDEKVIGKHKYKVIN